MVRPRDTTLPAVESFGIQDEMGPMSLGIIQTGVESPSQKKLRHPPFPMMDKL